MNIYRYTLVIGCAMTALTQSLAFGAPWTQFTAPLLGPQCITSGINDSGITIGQCQPANNKNHAFAWVAPAGGSQIALALYSAGQHCVATAVSNNGKISGGCADSNGVNFGMRWNANTPGTTPQKLSPLPQTLLFPLLRPADVSTIANLIDQQGNIVGTSFNSKKNGTVVFYANGSGTPQRISEYDYNCTPVGVTDPGPSTNKKIAMNCSIANGQPDAVVAEVTNSGPIGMSLARAPGANFCIARAMNDNGSVVGTCYYPKDPINNNEVFQAVYWAPNDTPTVLSISSGSKNTGELINNNEAILVNYKDNNGIDHPAVWKPVGSPPSSTLIPLPSGVTRGYGVFLSDNDIVGLQIVNANENTGTCTWSAAPGTTCLIQNMGGKSAKIQGASQSGSYMIGNLTNAGQSLVPATATLP